MKKINFIILLISLFTSISSWSQCILLKGSTNESSIGFADGKAVAQVSIVDINNPITPLSYLWSTGDTTFYLDSLTAGVYHVTIQGSNGCYIQDSIEIVVGNKNKDAFLVRHTTDIIGTSINDVSPITGDSIKKTYCSTKVPMFMMSNRSLGFNNNDTLTYIIDYGDNSFDTLLTTQVNQSASPTWYKQAFQLFHNHIYPSIGSYNVKYSLYYNNILLDSITVVNEVIIESINCDNCNGLNIKLDNITYPSDEFSNDGSFDIIFENSSNLYYTFYPSNFNVSADKTVNFFEFNNPLSPPPSPNPIAQQYPYLNSQNLKEDSLLIILYDFYSGCSIDTTFYFEQHTTSVKNNINSLSIKIYPNPTTSFLNVSFIKNIHKIKIFDSNGKRLYSKIVNYKNLTINTDILVNGIYIIEIESKNKKYYTKFSKT